jgi:hypothetical protein
MSIDSLNVYSVHLTKLADVGWVYVESKEEVDTVFKLLEILGFEAESSKEKGKKLYFIELR